MITPEEKAAGHIGFARAPQGWNWVAQTRRGTWYWFRRKPIPDYADGDWLISRDDVIFAGGDDPNPNWAETLRTR
jgi:hypothetical protein